MYAWLRLRICLKYRGFYGVNLAEIHKIQARTVQRIFFLFSCRTQRKYQGDRTAEWVNVVCITWLSEQQFSIWKYSGVKEDATALSKEFFVQNEDTDLFVKSIWPSEEFTEAPNRPFQWVNILGGISFDDPLSWPLEILCCPCVMFSRSLIQGPEQRMALKTKYAHVVSSLLECSWFIKSHKILKRLKESCTEKGLQQ